MDVCLCQALFPSWMTTRICSHDGRTLFALFAHICNMSVPDRCYFNHYRYFWVFSEKEHSGVLTYDLAVSLVESDLR
jgi:hypothetical protein